MGKKQAFLRSEYKIILSLPMAAFSSDFFSFWIPLSKRGKFFKIRAIHMEGENYIQSIWLVLSWSGFLGSWHDHRWSWNRLLSHLQNTSGFIPDKELWTRQLKDKSVVSIDSQRAGNTSFRRDWEEIIRPSPKTPTITFFYLQATCSLGDCWSI